MKARRFFLLMLTVLVLGATALAQNTSRSNANDGFTGFKANMADLHLISFSAATDHQRYVLPPNSEGESSSLHHPERSNGNTFSVAGQTVAVQTVNAPPCEEPAKLFSARDYSGPLSRFAAWFSRKPELSTVPKRRTGQTICSLSVGEKFHLFYKTTVDPVTFVGAAVAAGYAQWQNDDKEWGQGAEGYGMRYGAALTDRVTRNFFRKFFYPAIFRQDPRYYRVGGDNTGARFRHAVNHTFVTRTDSGGHFANLSLWAGVASTVAVENLYHPGNDRGFRPAAERAGISIAGSMGFDILREFWPEVVRKLHLPFRERRLTPMPVVPAVPNP